MDRNQPSLRFRLLASWPADEILHSDRRHDGECRDVRWSDDVDLRLVEKTSAACRNVQVLHVERKLNRCRGML